MGAVTARTHRLLDRVAIALALVRGRLWWGKRAMRTRSRHAADAIAGPGHARDAMARAHLAQHSAREMFIRRPSMVSGIPVEGSQHLRAAYAARRGVLVSYCHLGPFPGIGVTVAEHVADVHQVAGSWLSDPPVGAQQSLRWHRWRSMFDATRVPLISAKGCFPVVSRLLQDGGVVVMAFDWPGSAETSFLGKPVWLASGTAKLAETTGALVVPVKREFRRLAAHTVFGPPLDPRQHAGWRGLHEALAAQHERWILGHSAALEDPRRAGAWEDLASAEGWGRRE